jgi:hypothetical protein
LTRSLAQSICLVLSRSGARRRRPGNGRTACVLFFLLITIHLTGTGNRAFAAEGAASHYLPGTAGDIFIAQTPRPGWQGAYPLWVQSGNIGETVLQGRVNLDLQADSILNWGAFSYTFREPVLGLTYTVGGLLPVASVDLNATLTGPLGGTFRVEETDFGLTDAALVPF